MPLERKVLTPEEAEELLPDGDSIHTFRQTYSGVMLGADWSRARILQRFKTHGVELSGDNARKANHGLVSTDDVGELFIETRLEKKK